MNANTGNVLKLLENIQKKRVISTSIFNVTDECLNNERNDFYIQYDDHYFCGILENCVLDFQSFQACFSNIKLFNQLISFFLRQCHSDGQRSSQQDFTRHGKNVSTGNTVSFASHISTFTLWKPHSKDKHVTLLIFY